MQPLPGTAPAPSFTGSITSPAAPSRDELRELSGVEPLQSQEDDEFPWLEVGIGVGVALLFALLLYYVRRRRRPRPPERLEVTARRRLATLAALDSPDPRTFHAELALVLREYMEASLGLRAQRLTSREMLDAFRGNGHMNKEWQDRLEALLTCCDRAKFSREWDADCDPRASVAECRALLDALVVAVAAASRLASPWDTWQGERAS